MTAKIKAKKDELILVGTELSVVMNFETPIDVSADRKKEEIESDVRKAAAMLEPQDVLTDETKRILTEVMGIELPKPKAIPAKEPKAPRVKKDAVSYFIMSEVCRQYPNATEESIKAAMVTAEKTASESTLKIWVRDTNKTLDGLADLGMLILFKDVPVDEVEPITETLDAAAEEAK